MFEFLSLLVVKLLIIVSECVETKVVVGPELRDSSSWIVLPTVV